MALSTVDYICLISMLLVGLPHGAIDGPLMLRYATSRLVSVLLIIIYLVTAISVYLIWFIFPNFCLALFLGISIFHFGSGDFKVARQRLSEGGINLNSIIGIVTHGGIFPLLIPLVHQKETSIIFGILGASESQFLHLILSYMLPAWIACFVMYLFLCIRNIKSYLILFELLSLILIVIYFSPLVSFAIYFCCVHSPRHVLSLYRAIRAQSDFTSLLRMTIPFILLSWAIVLILVFLLFKIFTISFGEAVIQTTFILLFALTVPHMILIDGYINKQHIFSDS